MKIALFVASGLSLVLAAFLSVTTGPETADSVRANSQRGLNWVAIAALLYWMGVSQ